MSLAFDQKVEFIYKVMQKIAEEKQYLPLQEIWKHRYELSEEDIEVLITALGGLMEEAATGSDRIAYHQVEAVLLGRGWNARRIPGILGTLYAGGDERLNEFIGGLKGIPFELKRMIKKTKKYKYECLLYSNER
ncbi:MAG TPA: hypothetical protein PKA10_13690 [Selenomonadales bacterium]|nr:hypothetical protein [Selenomonadales bacterium]